MTGDMWRKSASVTVTIANGAALSDEVDFREMAGGVLHMPAVWTTAYIGFQVSPTSGGTFQPLYDDETGALVQLNPSASCSYSLPAKLYGARYVKLWSQNGSGTGANQGGARSIVVDFKG